MLVAQFPSRRFKRSSRSPVLPRIARTGLSRGLEYRLRSLMCSPGRGSLAFATRGWRPPVSMRRAASGRATVPLNSSSRFILPWRSSSSEFLRSNLPPSVFRRGPSTTPAGPAHSRRNRRELIRAQSFTYPGSLPSSRHHRSASTSREGCQASASFRPRAFSAPRRFPPPSGFASLFHLAATSRVRAVQGLLSPRSGALSSRALAPLPLVSRALTDRPAARFRAPPASRLPRSRTSTSRPFSARGSVAFGSGSTSPTLAPLFGFRLLQVFNRCLRLWFPRASARDGSFRGCSRSSPWAVLSVLSAAG